MRHRSGLVVGFISGIVASAVFGHAFWLRAQQTERPGCSFDNPIDTPRDLSGLSIRTPRIRVVHTNDSNLAGGSMYLQEVDPWLGYAWGRTLFQRQFRERDGVFGDTGKLDGVMLSDGATRMMDRGHVSSCGGCHNVPYRDAGAGMTIAKNGGTGRNSPHLFGGGLIEMIGQHLRLQALAVADDNRDGWIRMDEAKGKRCVIHNTDGPGDRVAIDYGSFDDVDGDGFPDLNPVYFPVFVDQDGKRIPSANNLKYPGVAGYTVVAQAFGFGHLYAPFRPPVQTTLRSFSIVPFDIHAGMQSCDPTCHTDVNGGALALVSNPGAQQFVIEAPRDRGSVKGPTGISLDDPDRDGYCEEITEGDLDVEECYLLNHPSPTRGEVTDFVRRGAELFAAIGCATCHTPDWHLPAAKPQAADYTQRHAGDRRFFDLRVSFNRTTEQLEGKLVSLADRKGDRWVPRRGPVAVRGVYSDFKYHDIGPDFYQMQWDGSLVKMWRTTPLWGVGSTAPYGHDGASLDLDSVIRRHGGEARTSRNAYAALPPNNRRDLLDFLNNLILFQTDQLPCDIDGDGSISDRFLVHGMDTGVERFNPEWLFRVPGKIEGKVTNIRGDGIISQAFTNVRAAFGLDLPYLKDTDGDGFPDVIDPAPRQPGYRDGVK